MELLELEEKLFNKYVEKGANKCIVCGSLNLDKFEGNADSEACFVEVNCKGCDNTWNEVYVKGKLDSAFMFDINVLNGRGY